MAFFEPMSLMPSPLVIIPPMYAVGSTRTTRRPCRPAAMAAEIPAGVAP